MTNVQEVIQDVLQEVVGAHAGEIGTHYDGCWKNHAACLAVYIFDLLPDNNQYHYARGYNEGFKRSYNDGYEEDRPYV